MSAESFISDEERYADDTFEQESDTEVQETTEIESEISEVSDAEDNDVGGTNLGHNSTINSNKVSSNYNSHHKSAPIQTDAVPFDSSSDEEDDVIVGQTLVEINTPSMHFQEEEKLNVTRRREIRPLKYQKTLPLKSIDEQSNDGSSVSEEEESLDSEEEREFQKIREMEESYLLQKSAKTPKNVDINNSQQLESSTSKSKSSASESSDEEEEEEDENQNVVTTNTLEEEEEDNDQQEVPSQTENKLIQDNDVDPIPELIDKIIEQFTPKPQVPQQIQTDFVEIVKNSLTNLQNQNDNEEKFDTIITDELPQSHRSEDSIRMTFSFEPNHILSPENIAKAFFDAMSATNITYATQKHSHSKAEDQQENDEEPKEIKKENDKMNSKSKSGSFEEPNKQNRSTGVEHGDNEIELEYEEKSEQLSQPADDNNDYDDESYYDTQFEYETTSKTPSCFNSDDYVFHANFIRPSPTTDRFRVKPHPRKSMSFSNERMREIERHNQILLRKILTQKPTYIAKSAQHKGQSNKTNLRLTTSAVNRKKQQRQIDLDNQVLKRKLEAIALRRKPLIT
ncbi:protein hemingway [Musca vetustissima]|uniref:protein hemingway n=1 Tax=Musca vetustissima TaxID=27455 RepID=UPI002AB5EA43|nr:protein hemingway [Musca vetustissima]